MATCLVLLFLFVLLILAAFDVRVGKTKKAIPEEKSPDMKPELSEKDIYEQQKKKQEIQNFFNYNGDPMPKPGEPE